ncbi:type 2 isopentenyl-diphosphate Delta-isomerase [Halalkalibacterium ligniniphilum]|uniref:type 2 isopentenyl-diphosphate Delta-isomerase n=2 Tax=Halalkalibacterium ligniniphilum TaxID=1134413 RepID=UPI0003492DC4|nr:type 2 isopentenyl-diphosphate Delta-isomerase [Halalkalibacterium ligniniphilum]
MSRAARKLDHINHALSIGQQRSHGFDDIRFVHNSVPETRVEDVNLSTKIGELLLSSPIFINAMTGGGGERTEAINRQLSEIAADKKIGMAVGSQMAAIKEPEQEKSYRVVREVNPHGVIIANLGSEATVEQGKRAVEMIEANALQIHLNVIQELVMPEGDRDFTGMLKRIENIVEGLHVPVIVKEVGFGMSRETAKKLEDIGVLIVDVGGFGGTNFSKIENERRSRSLHLFNDWGMTTTASIVEVSQMSKNLSVISSGGVQTGSEVVKSIALGASAVGIAGYFLKVLMERGQAAVADEVEVITEEIAFALAALGVNSVARLHTIPLVITGETYHWLQQRGINTQSFSQR